jgi:hypothetical protein
VFGLTATVVGLVTTALLLRHAPADRAAWTIAGPATLLFASGLMLLALLLAIAELLRRRHRPAVPAPTLRPEHHLSHL